MPVQFKLPNIEKSGGEVGGAIITCRANGIVALSYLKKFFGEVVTGRRDYEKLLPMTIEINTNKLKKSSSFFENFKRKVSQRGFPYRDVRIGRLPHKVAVARTGTSD